MSISSYPIKSVSAQFQHSGIVLDLNIIFIHRAIKLFASGEKIH